MKEQWGTVQQATAILSKTAGRPIDKSYVRSLVRAGHIGMRKKDGRTNEYNLNQCREYVVRRKGPAQEKSGQGDEQEPLALAI
jgi:hypothetical protein